MRQPVAWVEFYAVHSFKKPFALALEKSLKNCAAETKENEKYKGDARLQKKFTVDFLQKKMKVNEGEVPQYYVENSHEAIIDPLLFDRVQEEMARRKALGRSYSGKTIFSCRLICGDCGHYLGSKVWNSTSKYRRVIWQCNNKFKGECKCSTPHLTEDFMLFRRN